MDCKCNAKLLFLSVQLIWNASYIRSGNTKTNCFDGFVFQPPRILRMNNYPTYCSFSWRFFCASCRTKKSTLSWNICLRSFNLIILKWLIKNKFKSIFIKYFFSFLLHYTIMNGAHSFSLTFVISRFSYYSVIRLYRFYLLNEISANVVRLEFQFFSRFC